MDSLPSLSALAGMARESVTEQLAEAEALLVKERFTEAITALSEALETYAEMEVNDAGLQAAVLTARGNAYRRQGNVMAAHADFDRVLACTQATEEDRAAAATGQRQLFAANPLQGSSPPTVFTVSSSMLQLKEEGNCAFKLGQFGTAVEKYSAAILLVEQSPPDAQVTALLVVLLSNRAAAKLVSSDLGSCIEDCTAAVGMDSTCLKAYMRRAVAFEQLERFAAAAQDFRQVGVHNVSISLLNSYHLF